MNQKPEIQIQSIMRRFHSDPRGEFNLSTRTRNPRVKQGPEDLIGSRYDDLE